MAGKSKDRVAAPMVFNGTADSELFEHWFEYCFCPEIMGNIAILDNASIHRKKKLMQIGLAIFPIGTGARNAWKHSVASEVTGSRKSKGRSP